MGCWHNSAIILDDFMYWITEIEGDFIRLNLKTKKAKYMIPSNVVELPDMRSGNILFAEDYVLYGVSQGGKYLYAYDVKSNYCRIVRADLEDLFLHSVSTVKFINGSIYVVPSMGRTVVKIHIPTLKIELIDNPYKNDVEAGDTNLRNGLYFSDYVGSKVIYPSNEDRCFYEFNTLNKSYRIIEYPEQLGIIIMARRYGDSTYVINSDKELYRWNEEELVLLCKLKQVKSNYIFSKMNNKIWFFPGLDSDIFVFDINTLKCERFSSYPVNFKYDNPYVSQWGKYGLPVLNNEKEYIAMHCGNDIFVLDKNGDGKFLGIILPPAKEQIAIALKKNTIIKESLSLGVNSFLEYVLDEGSMV